MLRYGGGPEELQRVKYEIVRYTRGAGLDIGRGPFKAFPHFIGVREKGDTTVPPNISADHLVESFDSLADFIEGSLDFVFVWGVDYTPAISGQVGRLLKNGGRLILADLTDSTFNKTRRVDGVEIYHHDVSKYGSMYVRLGVGDRPEKTACVVRYGAIGDTLQSAAILPELKRQGYHVTVMCHPVGEELLRHDPHVDDFWIQDQDQVPNEELVAYWKVVAPKFDRFINLCESVEGTLLTYPGRANHRWPDAVRRKYCNVNYLEFMTEIAELPFHPEYQFYPSSNEEQKARNRIVRIREAVNKDTPPMGRSVEPYVVMWALSGSTVHKFYPHQDAVIASILLEIPYAHLIFVGDIACKILEAGWQNEPRIHCLSGELGLRDTLALAKQCNLVIGPETGVMNAVAFENSAKIVLLSHSTANNLTRDWVNTESLHSEITPCYPCHRLHMGREFCPEHKETGAAMCQADLPPYEVWQAVQRAYVGWGTVRKLMAA
jgi:ADP-heptose:LPS heptosyltransferase